VGLLMVTLLLLLLLHPFNGHFSRTTWVSWYQKGKTSLDLNEARDDRVWGMAVASAGPYANNLHLSRHITRLTALRLVTQFLDTRCSSRRSNNSVKALKDIRKKQIKFAHDLVCILDGILKRNDLVVFLWLNCCFIFN